MKVLSDAHTIGRFAHSKLDERVEVNRSWGLRRHHAIKLRVRHDGQGQRHDGSTLHRSNGTEKCFTSAGAC